MRKTVAALVCASALTLLAGCSSAQEEVPQVGPTGEQSSVSPQTDAPVVDLPAEEAGAAGGGSVVDDGMAMSQSPDGWPADVPIPRDGQLQAWAEVDGRLTASWLILGTEVVDAGNAYASDLESGGWEGGSLAESADEPGMFTTTYARGSESLTIRARPGAGYGEVDVTVEYASG